jgi:hypothetical protein
MGGGRCAVAAEACILEFWIAQEHVEACRGQVKSEGSITVFKFVLVDKLQLQIYRK